MILERRFKDPVRNWHYLHRILYWSFPRETTFIQNLIVSKVEYKIKFAFYLEAFQQPRSFQQCDGTGYEHT